MAILIIVSRPKGSAGIAIPIEYIKSNQFDLAAGFVISLPDSKSVELTSGASKSMYIVPSSGTIAVGNLANAKTAKIKFAPSVSTCVASTKVTYTNTGSAKTLNVYHKKGKSCESASMQIVDKTVSTPIYHKFIGGAYAASC